MGLLILGLILFIGIHLLPAVPSLRMRLVAAVGDMAYRGLFALVAGAGLVLLVIGYSDAPFRHVWTPPSWGASVNAVLMIGACLALPAAYIPSRLRLLTLHPMLWALLLWAVGHLLANGDLASVLLFGGLGLYAAVALVSVRLRGAGRAMGTATRTTDMLVATIGVALYIVLLMAHPYLFGVAVVP